LINKQKVYENPRNITIKSLKESFKELIAVLIRLLGLHLIIREVVCRNMVTVVHYHDPKPEIFEKHIEYLSKYYNFISLNQLVQAVQNKDWSKVPQKSIIITFDDGYKGNYKLLNIFKKYNIKPTIYLCSHMVNTNPYLHEENEYNKISLKNNRKIKKINVSVETKCIDEKEIHSQNHSLNKSELIKMLPYIEIGSHTKYHSNLTRCENEKCKDEIINSKKFLELLLKRPIEHFSYPFGQYTGREIKYLKRYGYKSARTIDCGWNSSNTNLFRIKVTGIQDDASINKLCAQISGFFPFIKYLVKTQIRRVQKINN
jgi:peptidoglycan/xylan/chitin deacetylase (PgdA/CDA1 family)